jgi:hypothetical protein
MIRGAAGCTPNARHVTSYDLAHFCDDVHDIITAEGEAGLPRVAEKVRELLANPAFVAATWDASTPPGKRVLHHDPATDVYVLAHVHPAGRAPGAPHSHGTSWAVYGNAKGYTDMTIWQRVNSADDDHAELVIAEQYRLAEGEARSYSAGAIHSTLQPEPAWVLRVTGTDLDVLPRFRFKPGRDAILEAHR